MIINLSTDVKNALKNSNRVLIHGVPGVGKTHFVEEFCDYNYHYSIIIDCEFEYELLETYRNIEEDEEFYKAFRRDFGLLDALPEDIYVGFDNIECSAVFCENLYYRFVKMGINLIMTMRVRNKRVENICVETEVLVMRPMPYMEMYYNSKSGLDVPMIRQMIQNGNIPQFLHETMSRNFEDYLNLGGMPIPFEMLKDQKVNEDKVKSAYRANRLAVYDMIEHYSDLSDLDKTRAKAVLDSVFYQMLTTDYKKFVVGHIRDGVTYNEYSTAIEFLVKNNILIKVDCEDNSKNFLLFLYDCGILYYGLLQLSNYNNLGVNSSEILDIVKRNFAITEITNYGYDVRYWRSDRIASVDCIYEYENNVFACVVEALGNKKTKSLMQYGDKHSNSKLIHLTNGNIEKKLNFFNVPIYAISCINYRFRMID